MSIKSKIKSLFKQYWVATAMIIAILLISFSVAAEDRVTNVEKMPLDQRCGITSSIIFAGILTRERGVSVEEEIDWAEAQAIKDNPGFRPFNENERSWLTKYYTLGASMADQFKEANGRWPTKQEAYNRASRLNEACIKGASEAHDGGLKVKFVADPADIPRDRVDDIRAMPVVKYCEYIAVLYATGINARNDGRPLLFKSVTKHEVMHSRTLPMDGIYMIEMDTFTTREKMFVLKHVTAGWEYADARYAAGDKPQPLGDPYMDGAAKYMVECMANENPR
jgi:hypothetical protein